MDVFVNDVDRETLQKTLSRSQEQTVHIAALAWDTNRIFKGAFTHTATSFRTSEGSPVTCFQVGLLAQAVPTWDSDDKRQRDGDRVRGRTELIVFVLTRFFFKGKRILDVGCGLGGGSIYWAQEHGAHVTGLTCAADHVPVIQELAKRAGVDTSVNTLLCDACDVPIGPQYDAVVAMESSCYFPRKKYVFFFQNSVM